MPGGIAVVRDGRVLWSWGVGDMDHCWELYGRESTCPRCPGDGPIPRSGVCIDHPRGPAETVLPLPECRLLVWSGGTGPVHPMPEAVGIAAYGGDGRVARWEGVHATLSGVDSSRALGQTARRLMARIRLPRVARQVDLALGGNLPPPVRTADGTFSALFNDSGRVLHLLLDLVRLGAVEPEWLPRLCFRHGGATCDLVSRLVTLAESRGWSYDISSAAADGLPTWMLPESLDRLLAGTLEAMSDLCPERWLSCSTMRADASAGASVLPGRYHVVGFRGGAAGSWRLRRIGGLAALARRLGGFVDVEAERETVRVALPKALDRDPNASGILAFGGGQAPIAGLLKAASELRLRVRECADQEELQQLQTGAEAILVGTAGGSHLPAALAARIPCQPLMVAAGSLHTPAEPGSPEQRLPLPASRESMLKALRGLLRSG
mgnify:CR=1 FL=1